MSALVENSRAILLIVITIDVLVRSVLDIRPPLRRSTLSECSTGREGSVLGE